MVHKKEVALLNMAYVRFSNWFPYSEQTVNKVPLKRNFPKVDALLFMFPSLNLCASLLRMCSIFAEQEGLLGFKCS